MAEYERILESARKLLKDANALTADLSGTFSTLTNVNQVYLKFKTENDSEDNAMEQACSLVLHSDFIVMKCSAAFLSSVDDELRQRKSNLPQRVLPIVAEIETYFKKMDDELKEVDKTVQQMWKKIEEIGMRDGKLTGLENFQLKLLMEKLTCGIEKAENYQNKADKALETLQSEFSSYLMKEGFLAAASTAAIAGAAGAFAFGASALYVNVTQKAVSTMKNVTASGGVFSGASLVYHIWSLNPLIIGASVGGIYLFFSLKRWFTKRDLYHKLSLNIRNYSDKVNESQSLLSYQ